PSTVATPIDPSVTPTLAATTSFLYAGPNPIQTGVAAGTISPIRAAVLRGKVLTRDGQPLSGVTITILGHPEYGQTLSRADGMFDTDGTRRATLLFSQGTQATMVLADGSTQPLSTLHVRTTEFTVGPNGTRAMPAELPPTSAYTYAVEYSADEALAAGAREVQ